MNYKILFASISIFICIVLIVIHIFIQPISKYMMGMVYFLNAISIGYITYINYHIYKKNSSF
ncbi:hypothetical protein SAMN04488541_10385 [Thermoflexibacter ruber]|uniref:Uncharacterized protein n=1 Tax=Thermoflexibacter ruber TaxID=1003 RepID=A0A1I2J1W0_9BACT|nr:hypothetical protein SAMN04488541_10385 [Thermoflexibacter ruber]